MVSGQDLQIVPDTREFTYNVTASGSAGAHSFEGYVSDLDRVRHDIDGESSVTVRAPTTSTASAERSFSPATVEPGGQVAVTIVIANFQLGVAVVETLPADFSYVTDSLSSGTVVVSGQDLQIVPDTREFTYNVTASGSAGAHSFEGYVSDLDRVRHDIDGESSVTVRAPTTSTASAERAFSPATVEPGGQVAVTIVIANFQLGVAVVETLPSGFSYVKDSLSSGTVVVSGQDLQIVPDTREFTYNVTASGSAGAHSFEGYVSDLDRVRHDNGGEFSVTVRARTSTGGGGGSTGGGGGVGPIVSPTVTPTPEPQPEPTATPEPQPEVDGHTGAAAGVDGHTGAAAGAGSHRDARRARPSRC